jgi:hypothetical protein
MISLIADTESMNNNGNAVVYRPVGDHIQKYQRAFVGKKKLLLKTFYLHQQKDKIYVIKIKLLLHSEYQK